MTASDAKLILEIFEADITLEELKKIFKKKIFQWHPDLSLNRGITEQEATYKSQQIILAYEILSNNIESLQDVTFNADFETYHSYKTKSTRNYKKYYDFSIDDLDEKFINRIIVKSSNVKWIDYLKDIEILVVRFRRSTVFYLYFDVPVSIYLMFQKSDSPGRFVHQYLKGYKYESLSKYEDWLNIYKSLIDITENI